MNNSLKKYHMGQLCKVKHGFPFDGSKFSSEGKYIVLTPGNFYEKGGFKRIVGKEKYYSDSFPDEYLSKKGDLIVAMTQQADGLLGSTALVPEDGLYLHNQRVGLVLHNDNLVDKFYLYYLFMTKGVRKQITDSASGTKVKHTSPEKISGVEISIPSLPIQRKNAHLLYSIEQGLQLNEQICVELEAMAKTLYDYWFVQFDFPDENGKPYRTSGGEMVWNEQLKREIPKGWEAGQLSDIANITMGQSPVGSSYNKDGDGTVFYQGSTDFGNRFPEPRVYTTAPTRFAKAGDILMSVRAPVGTLNVALTDCCIGRGLAALSSKIGSQLHLMYALVDFKSHFDIIDGNGTTFGSITKDALYDMQVVVPSTTQLLAFECTVQSIEQKIRQCELENRELAKLRDWLLPMLMNGQATVSDEEPQQKVIPFPTKTVKVRQAARSFDEAKTDDTTALLNAYLRRMNNGTGKGKAD